MTASARSVLLVNPNRLKPAVAPIALDYLGSALRRSGFDVDLLDLCFENDWGEAVNACLARLSSGLLAVAITLRNTDDAHYAGRQFFLPELRQLVQRTRARTNVPIVLGGAGFSVMPGAILAYCGLELGIWGEGEEALPLLLRRLQEGQAPGDVPGLVYQRGSTYLRNPPRYLDLGQVETPSRDIVDNRRYFLEGGQGGIETKRGCPMRCVYCADPLGKGSRTRCRPPASVADEAGQLLSMDIDHLHLCDSEFNVPAWHAREVCQELVRRGLGERLRWYAYCTPAPFNRETARLFLRAGCAGINFGVDSGTDRMLATLGRHYRVEEIARTAEACRAEGLPFMFDLLLGGPGEDRETLRQTIELMKALSPDRVGAALGIRVYPGTALAAMVSAQGPLGSNPSLKGAVEGNEACFEPVYYVSAELGDDPLGYLETLIGGDQRFFRGSRGLAGQGYNYADNRLLVEAIRSGCRGAYWDILRRLASQPTR